MDGTRNSGLGIKFIIENYDFDKFYTITAIYKNKTYFLNHTDEKTTEVQGYTTVKTRPNVF